MSGVKIARMAALSRIPTADGTAPLAHLFAVLYRRDYDCGHLDLTPWHEGLDLMRIRSLCAALTCLLLGDARVYSAELVPIQQSWQEEASFAPNANGFAETVAMSGNYMISGAKTDGNGKAYIYRRDSGQWTQDAQLVPAEPTTRNLLGYSVDIFGDVAVASAPWEQNERGAVYVFRRSSSGWLQEAKLTASNGSSDNWFGESVAIDDNRIVVGAPRRQTIYGGGVSYVFEYANGQWAQSAELRPFDYSQDVYAFGKSVAIDGDKILIGSPLDEGRDETSAFGSAYFYGFDGSSWVGETRVSQTGLIKDDRLGSSVSLDGHSAAVASIGFGAGTTAHVNVLRFDGTEWITEQSIVPEVGQFQDDNLHQFVAIEGNWLALGSPGSDLHARDGGTVHLYRRQGSSWIAEGQLAPGDLGSFDRFGLSVDIEGKSLVVGSYRDGHKVFAFTIPEPSTLTVTYIGVAARRRSLRR